MQKSSKWPDISTLGLSPRLNDNTPHNSQVQTLTKTIYINKVKLSQSVTRTGISSLKGQGHFHFAERTSIGNDESQFETFEGAPRPRPRAMEPMAFMACL